MLTLRPSYGLSEQDEEYPFAKRDEQFPFQIQDDTSKG